MRVGELAMLLRHARGHGQITADARPDHDRVTRKPWPSLKPPTAGMTYQHEDLRRGRLMGGPLGGLLSGGVHVSRKGIRDLQAIILDPLEVRLFGPERQIEGLV